MEFISGLSKEFLFTSATFFFLWFLVILFLFIKFIIGCKIESKKEGVEVISIIKKRSKEGSKIKLFFKLLGLTLIIFLLVFLIVIFWMPQGMAPPAPNAVIRSNLLQINSTAEQFWFSDEQGSYEGLSDELRAKDMLEELPGCSAEIQEKLGYENPQEYQIDISEDGTAYLAWAPLCNYCESEEEIIYYCVDSDGYAGEIELDPFDPKNRGEFRCPVEKSEEELTAERDDSIDYMWIEKEDKLNEQQFGKSYIFTLEEGKSLIFEKHEEDLTDWKGDIFIGKDGENHYIKKDVDIYGPGGFSYEVYSTNKSGYLILEHGHFYEFLDAERRKVVATIFSDFSNFWIEGTSGKLNIEFDMDSCKEKSPGEIVILDGISINETTVFNFDEPFELTCVYPDGIGSLYDPDPTIKEVNLSQDLSRIKLILQAGEREEEIEFKK